MKNQKMGSIVLRSLSILLGLFFIFVGLIKISSVVSKDLHKDLLRLIVLKDTRNTYVFDCREDKPAVLGWGSFITISLI
ncbi:hypothetical protein NQ314_008412 [Rhamnusium bicolor]|uniref:Uncharacterized protein n=1 Tax=Rhamnusium bicolor TaxID=1586634 RepID=A0AAV8YA49_9CUCU|nr:hypothetical protein NQ314_008412 [Rhamnusium bicolor]